MTPTRSPPASGASPGSIGSPRSTAQRERQDAPHPGIGLRTRLHHRILEGEPGRRTDPAPAVPVRRRVEVAADDLRDIVHPGWDCLRIRIRRRSPPRPRGMAVRMATRRTHATAPGTDLRFRDRRGRLVLRPVGARAQGTLAFDDPAELALRLDRSPAQQRDVSAGCNLVPKAARTCRGRAFPQLHNRIGRRKREPQATRPRVAERCRHRRLRHQNPDRGAAPRSTGPASPPGGHRGALQGWHADHRIHPTSSSNILPREAASATISSSTTNRTGPGGSSHSPDPGWISSTETSSS